MELQLINELSESRLFRSIDRYQEYTLQDVAELTYIYVLILELFRTTNHKDFAQKYVKNTIRFNNFHSFKFSANDLYHFSHLLVGEENERSLARLKNTSHKIRLDFMHYRKFLRDIVSGTIDEAFDKRYLLRLEAELGIKNSNLRAIRRMITNWLVQEDMSMAKSAATKLLLEIRKRALKSELRMELEKFGRLNEYKIIKTKTTIVYENPSHNEFLKLLNDKKDLRGLLDNNGTFYTWNAYSATHTQIQNDLGLGIIDYLTFEPKEGRMMSINNIAFDCIGEISDFLNDEKYALIRRALGGNKLDEESKLDEYRMIKVDVSDRTAPTGEINVFKNPSHQELKMLLQRHNALRAILDVNENIYVWNAYEAIHYQVEKQLEDEIDFTRVNLSFHEELPAEWDGVKTDTSIIDNVLWKEINGIWIEGYDPGTSRAVIPDAKFLKRALGVNNLNEYKIIKTNITKVYKNPMKSEFLALLNKHKELRGLIDEPGNVYIWNAYDSEHSLIIRELQMGNMKGLFFALENYLESDQYDVWDLKNINGIWFGDDNISRAKHNSPHLKRLFDSKLNEYKMIKVDQYHPGPNGGSSSPLANVFKNPTRQEFLSLVNQFDLRGLVDREENLYVWDASKSIHFTMGQELALHIKDDTLAWYDRDAPGASGAIFYDNLMFVKERDFAFSEWDFVEAEGKDGHDVLFASRSQRRKDQGFPGADKGRHAIEHSRFVKRALGIDVLKEYKLIKNDITNIFKNPTRQEFLALLEQYDLRGLTDSNNNLYIWNANHAIHWQIKNNLELLFDNSYYFTKEWVSNEWNLKEFNGIWLGVYNKENLKSKFLRKVMDWDMISNPRIIWDYGDG